MNDQPTIMDMTCETTARAEFARVHAYLHAEHDLDDQITTATRRMLALGLSMRDALIAAAIRPDAVDADAMTGFALHAHEPHNATRLSELLTDAFENGTGYTSDVIDRLDALMDAVAHTPTAPSVQCLAVRAYLAWWRDDRQAAMPLALHALDLDDSCTLATIVLAALTRDVHPNTK